MQATRDQIVNPWNWYQIQTSIQEELTTYSSNNNLNSSLYFTQAYQIRNRSRKIGREFRSRPVIKVPSATNRKEASTRMSLMRLFRIQTTLVQP